MCFWCIFSFLCSLLANGDSSFSEESLVLAMHEKYVVIIKLIRVLWLLANGECDVQSQKVKDTADMKRNHQSTSHCVCEEKRS